MNLFILWPKGYEIPGGDLCESIIALYHISPSIPGMLSSTNQTILDLMLAGF